MSPQLRATPCGVSAGTEAGRGGSRGLLCRARLWAPSELSVPRSPVAGLVSTSEDLVKAGNEGGWVLGTSCPQDSRRQGKAVLCGSLPLPHTSSPVSLLPSPRPRQHLLQDVKFIARGWGGPPGLMRGRQPAPGERSGHTSGPLMELLDFGQISLPL